MASGSYFPPPVKEVEISKKDEGIRKLGIPMLLSYYMLLQFVLANVFVFSNQISIK
jgi:retron-type reverse transcriptase